MAARVRHAYQTATANDPTDEVSADVWNADHELIGLGTAAEADSTDFATAAQGALADSAVQPGDLAAVATSGAYADLSGTPTISGTNTGDQTSIVGITGTKAQFDTACTDGNFAYQSDLSGYQAADADLTTLSDLNAATGKTTPVDADLLPLADSAASNVFKKLTWANLKATLKTYLDTLYAPIVPVFVTTTSAVSLGNDANAHALFASANDTLTLAANTTYRVRGRIRITNGGTSHTDSLGFGGTATFTSIALEVFTSKGNSGSGITANTGRVWMTSASALAITAAGVQTGVFAAIEGLIRTNAGGTIIPQWTFSVDPTGTNQVEPNSWMSFEPWGSDTVVSNGGWA